MWLIQGVQEIENVSEKCFRMLDEVENICYIECKDETKC